MTKMQEPNKTNNELLQDLEFLRRRVAELEKLITKQKTVKVSNSPTEKKLQKQAETLENHQKRLEAILDIIPTPIIFIEPETGRVTFTNKVANQLINSDLTKHTSLEEYPPTYYCTDANGERISKEEMPAIRLAKGEKLEKYEVNWHTEKSIYSTLCWGETLPPLYGLPSVCIGIFQDVTKLKKLEKKLNQTEGELQRTMTSVKTIGENTDLKVNEDTELENKNPARSLPPNTVEELFKSLKQKEKALQKSQECLSLAIESAELGMWDYDLISGELLWSERCKQIFGIAPDSEMSYKIFSNAVHPDDREWVDRAVKNSIATQENYNIEYRTLWPDRSVHWVAAIGRVYWNEHNQPIRMAGVAMDITQRKQSEQAQWEAQERLRVAIKNSPLTVFNHDRELRYTWIYNPTFDYASDAIVGKRDEELLSAEEAAVLTRIKRQVLETGVGRREEVKLTTLGRVWYYDMTVEPLRNNVGEAIGITCAAVDVSERKQAEAERERLLASERQARAQVQKAQRELALIFETSPVGMGLLDREQRFVAINEALAQINGLSREQHLGRSIPELFGLLDPHLVKVFERLYATGKPFISAEFPVYVPGREDRRPGYYDVYYLPTSKGTELVEGVLVYVVDVSDRVRLEQARDYLAEATTLLAASVEYETTLERVAQIAVPKLADWCTVHTIEDDGSIQQIAVAHRDPTKIEWAHRIQEKYPLNPNDPRGAAFTLRTGKPDLLPEIPDQLLVTTARDPEHLEILRQVGFKSAMTVPLGTPERILGVLSFIWAESGRRYNQSDLMLAEELASRATLAIDNAKLYRAAQRDRARAEAANQVKDQFLAVLSHELRTPLNPIQGWARLLRSRTLDAKKTAIALETIERNAKLQGQLIEDLLDISRILQGKLHLTLCPINLKTIMEAAIETVRLSAQTKSIQIASAIAPNVGQVLGDFNRLQQVIWNLLSNAIKFTPAGGQIEVRLQQVGSQAQIVVKDNGKGICTEFLPYVFEAFRQADATTTRVFGGLGLGLSIARHLVELHGGSIRAESSGINHGATFTVRLPLMALPPNNEYGANQATQTPDLNGLRVLAVDDDPDSLELLTFILEQSGATVTSVGSAPAALAVMAQSHPDIILSDIGMPEVDGYMLMRQVRARMPEQGGQIPAIALTAYAGEYNQQQALAAGFQLHVPKPVEPEDLLRAIASLLRDNYSEP